MVAHVRPLCWVIAHSNLSQVPTLLIYLGEVTGCDAGCQKASRCSTRGEIFGGMYITFTPIQEANKAEPTLALKPRGDVTRNPKQEYQWPPKRTCMCAKNL